MTELVRKPASATNSGELDNSQAPQTIAGNKQYTGTVTTTGSEATSSTAGFVRKNKFQTVTLAQDFTSSSTDISTTTGNGTFKFVNLVIGKVYEVTAQFDYLDASAVAGRNPDYRINHDGNVIARNSREIIVGGVEATGDGHLQLTTGPFIATNTTITFSVVSATASYTTRGNGTVQESWAKIVELNNYESVETTDFT